MATTSWQDVCAVEDITPGTGVAALIGAVQLALIRSSDGQRVYALDNFDPYSKTFVIARGIVGDRGGIPKIASPMYKQNFDLRTGVCLDDPTVSLRTFPVRIINARIEVRVQPESST